MTQTTAHTLAFALGFLALYPDSQDRVFREIQCATGDFQRKLVRLHPRPCTKYAYHTTSINHHKTYDDARSLTYTSAYVL